MDIGQRLLDALARLTTRVNRLETLEAGTVLITAGVVSAYHRATHTADVTVAGTLYHDVPVAWSLGPWLMAGAVTYGSACGIAGFDAATPGNGCVVYITDDDLQNDPLDPTTGHKHRGLVDDGPTVGTNGDIAPTMWDDLRVDASTTRLGGNDPGFAVFKTNGAGSRGVFIYWFDPDAIEEVFFSVQLPHSWKGTAIYPHVHWVPKTADAGGTQTVEWGLEYTWANIAGTFANTNIVYAKSAGSHTTAGQHILTNFAAITPGAGTQDGISSMMICRLFRNATDAVDDTYADDAGLLEFDIHYEMDTVGSHTASAK